MRHLLLVVPFLAAACGGTVDPTGTAPAQAAEPLTDEVTSQTPVITTLADTYPVAPGPMAIDSTHVYWSQESGDVLSVPIGGGAAVTLAQSSAMAQAVAVDTDSVYWGIWAASGAVLKVPKAGGVTSTFASSTYGGEVAVRGGDVYWSDDANILTSPASGGTPTTLASGQDALSLTVNGSDVGWINFGAGEVIAMPRGGGAATTLVSSQVYPRALALDATSAFWVAEGRYFGHVSSVALGGGATPVRIASHQNVGSIGAIAVDEKFVYWAANDSIVKAPIAGGKPKTIANAYGPVALAVDATSLYWTWGSGYSVMKMTPK